MGNGQSPVGSVDRALVILQEIGRHGRGVTLDELATRLDIPKSSLHRLLGALKHRGFAAQHEANGPYFVGTELLATAFRFYESMDLRTLIHPLLLRLCEKFRETAHMAVLDGGEVVYLDKVEVPRSITMTSVVGGRNAAHCTGVGKALLAWTYPTDEAIKAWAAQYGPLAAPSRNTITNPAKLAAHMAQVRERGYALDLEENEPGVRCVAVPVFMGRSTPLASVSVTALKDRMPPARFEELGEALCRMVAEHAGTVRPAT
ncbi:IclR family transcriptional regulator [Streptosporangium sp. NPDC000396]|uniref:IclR family transcriptional regulator n=1 Tax=Streptosporangium sp. NPDC000396 TaxID=3366185 RepID=UPI0036943B4D